MSNPSFGMELGANARYEFNYVTPTVQPDGSGGQITVDVPTTFALSSISLDVAQGLLRGLTTVGSIKNATCNRVRDASDSLSGGNLL